MARYVEVAVALPVRGTFHYGVPARLAARVHLGGRVLAPFGGRGVSGVVISECGAPPAEVDKVRDLEAVLDGPPLTGELVELCKWIAQYYEAPLGEVLRAAFPPGSQVAAHKEIEMTPMGRAALGGGALPKKWRELLAVLDAAEGRLPRKQFGGKAATALAELVAAGMVVESLASERPRVRTRNAKFVRLLRELDDAGRTALGRAHSQLAIVEQLSRAGGEIEVAALRARDSAASTRLRPLAKAGWIRSSSGPSSSPGSSTVPPR